MQLLRIHHSTGCHYISNPALPKNTIHLCVYHHDNGIYISIMSVWVETLKSYPFLCVLCDGIWIFWRSALWHSLPLCTADSMIIKNKVFNTKCIQSHPHLLITKSWWSYATIFLVQQQPSHTKSKLDVDVDISNFKP